MTFASSGSKLDLPMLSKFRKKISSLKGKFNRYLGSVDCSLIEQNIANLMSKAKCM